MKIELTFIELELLQAAIKTLIFATDTDSGELPHMRTALEKLREARRQDAA